MFVCLSGTLAATVQSQRSMLSACGASQQDTTGMRTERELSLKAKLSIYTYGHEGWVITEKNETALTNNRFPQEGGWRLPWG